MLEKPEMMEKPEAQVQTDISMEEILTRTTNLTVLDDEGWEINDNGAKAVASLCAKGRLCSNRPMSRSLLKTILGRVWGINDKNWSVEIKCVVKESSFLVFSFKSSQDLNRILIKNPWFLNNGILIMERLDEIPEDWSSVLTSFPLIGRILRLPTRSITQMNMERLAMFAGAIIEVQKADIAKIASKGFFTFKVWCDITKPLCPGFLFPKPVKFFEDGSGNRIQGYGTWLKVDDNKVNSETYDRGQPIKISQYSSPPGFPTQRASQAELIGTNLGNNATESSSKTRCIVVLQKKEMSSVGIPNISKPDVKGKALENDLEAPFGLPTTNQLIPNINSKPVGQDNMEVVCERLYNAKRDGSWRDEGLAINTGECNLINGLSNFSQQGVLANQLHRDLGNLIEVPISYYTNCDALKKNVGSSKRRKIVPKINKTTRKCCSTEALMADCSLAKDDDRDGRTIRINEDSWIPRSSPYTLRNKVQIPPDLTISSVLQQNGQWKSNEVISWFHKEDIPWVLGITPNMNKPDWLTWSWNHNGIYSVASADALWWSHDHLSKDDLTRFIGCSWLVWQIRNAFIFQHKVPNDHYWRKWALDLLDIHLGTQQQVQQTSRVNVNQKLQPPPKDFIMVNTDVALVFGKAAEAEFLPGCLSVLLAKVTAIQLGIQLARRRSISHAIIASDCQAAITTLQNNACYPTDWGQLVGSKVCYMD
ncbi:hypothetical protein G4B88_021738 [Cannabis sativa]|uniref:DUF4283 domain-containing protein n=1 Tax=Cannabis sativa TaxID=3483 RepID=A0A7J6FB66_CANSA|nr:hypothetical protein G4B88_021738 [Cannabis sativa]